MGAKQSKRSVDISGKEAESAGEVAAGAGGEGRVEALADADALKPQLNGDAHIHEQTDKEKQLDSGTPENEKDATTEKEGKEQENGTEKEKEAAVTNGDSESKGENGDSSPAPEEGKKPKKEKVKKKWSLRSISFSRKDKPKQEKKQKEEEPKTNGEPEKVPEEAAEATPENATNEVAEEALPKSEVKEEKTPETPVTEPLTNGSSTPDEPKAVSPVPEEPAPVPAAPVEAPAPAPVVEEPASPVPAPAEPEVPKPEPKVEIEPDQLPVNGLSLKEETPEAPHIDQSKPDPPAAEATESAPAPEIPVKKEVCVEQMPVDSTPPPLPENPPPSSVASFAATTMAPELTDASLPNPAELVISAQLAIPDTKTSNNETIALEPQSDVANEVDRNIESVLSPEPLIENSSLSKVAHTEEQPAMQIESEITTLQQTENIVASEVETLDNTNTNIETSEQQNEKAEEMLPLPEENLLTGDEEKIDVQIIQQDNQPEANVESNLESPISVESDKVSLTEETLDSIDDLPPPPPLDNEFKEDTPVVNQNGDVKDVKEIDNSDHITNNVEVNGIDTEMLNGNDDVDHKNLKINNDLIDNVIDNVESNGNPEIAEAKTMELKQIETLEEKVSTPEESLPPSLSEASEAAGSELSDGFPPPPPEAAPAPLDTPQEPLPVSDKLADLIPEVPVVPELNTETLQETTTDVAVAN